jgi:hypothetical protein
MRKITRLVAVALVVAIPVAGLAMGNGKGKGRGKPGPVQCPTDVFAALDLACPCPGRPLDSTGMVAPWRNHGQFVSCVAHFRNALRKGHCADPSSMRSIVRCAARSSCGREDAVLCCRYTTGMCSDPNPADLVAQGTCSNGGAACNADADCTQSSARVVHDAASCTSDGGVVVPGGGTVCAPCPPPGS